MLERIRAMSTMRTIESRCRLTQTILWPSLTAVLLGIINIYSVHYTRVDLRGTGQADPEREVMQSGNPDTFFVDTFKDRGYGRQEYYRHASARGTRIGQMHDSQ